MTRKEGVLKRGREEESEVGGVEIRGYFSLLQLSLSCRQRTADSQTIVFISLSLSLSLFLSLSYSLLLRYLTRILIFRQRQTRDCVSVPVR